MFGSNDLPGARPIPRGTLGDGVGMLAFILAWIFGYTVVRGFVLKERDGAEHAGIMWTDELEADSAYRSGTSPQRIPEGLTGLDSAVWVVYELRDERRRATANLFSDSALAHTACGTACSAAQVDSTRVASYRDRVVRDVLARAELEVELAARGPSLSQRLSEVWPRLKNGGFTGSDVLVVIGGGIIIALILKYLPVDRARQDDLARSKETRVRHRTHSTRG